MQQIFLRGLYAAVFAVAVASVPVGTTLYLNGVAYSRFDRLTLNGEGNAGVAVDQSKADGTSKYFDVENEYADDVFENASTIIQMVLIFFSMVIADKLRATADIRKEKPRSHLKLVGVAPDDGNEAKPAPDMRAHHLWWASP
jgi:hypothetical protein